MDRDCANCDYSGNSFSCCENEPTVKCNSKPIPAQPLLTYEEWQKWQKQQGNNK